jgi:hypothetical protein
MINDIIHWWYQRKERKIFRFARTLQQKITWCNPTDGEMKPTGESSIIYYTLMENGNGERKCDISYDDKAWSHAKTSKTYNTKVVPWLHHADIELDEQDDDDE